MPQKGLLGPQSHSVSVLPPSLLGMKSPPLPCTLPLHFGPPQVQSSRAKGPWPETSGILSQNKLFLRSDVHQVFCHSDRKLTIHSNATSHSKAADLEDSPQRNPEVPLTVTGPRLAPGGCSLRPLPKPLNQHLLEL